MTDIDALIDEAVHGFEEYNRLHIEDFISPHGKRQPRVQSDPYIGSDVFKSRIKDWLGFFCDDDIHIYLKLLQKYKYYPSEELDETVYNITEKVFQASVGACWDDIFFITFPSKRGVKSGGDDLRAILQLVRNGDIPKDNIICDIKLNIETLNTKAKVIVFLDDIVGTGETLYGKIKEAIQVLELPTKPNVQVFAACIIARQGKFLLKMKQLNKLGVIVTPIFADIAEKCFDQMNIFMPNEREKYKQIVKIYEEIIEETSVKKNDAILGYKKNQLLVTFRYNTPNNTLSSFWKPSKENYPIFLRTDFRRPDINQIKEARKNSRDIAYFHGKSRGMTNGNV